MKLTKIYRVLHKGTVLLTDEIIYPEGSVTYPADGITPAEFDSEIDATQYIADNGLIQGEI